MKHIFEYPVAMFLRMDNGKLLDTTAALKITDNATNIEVDTEALLDLIAEHEVRFGV